MAKTVASIPFVTIQSAPDTRTVCERLGDVLSESHREDTPEEFRLGLLQGALAIALPHLLALEAVRKPPPRVVIRTTRRRAAHA